MGCSPCQLVQDSFNQQYVSNSRYQGNLISIQTKIARHFSGGFSICAMVKIRYIGDGHPTLILIMGT